MDITSELTIVIPVRMDSKEREENLRAILPYLISYTYATILVMEVDEEQKFFLKNTDKRIKYYFKKDTDVIFITPGIEMNYLYDRRRISLRFGMRMFF